jgi:hypothetical protein
MTVLTTDRLGKLRLLQEAAKKAERSVIYDHDYVSSQICTFLM